MIGLYLKALAGLALLTIVWAAVLHLGRRSGIAVSTGRCGGCAGPTARCHADPGSMSEPSAQQEDHHATR